MPGFSACTWTQQPDDSWATQCGREVDLDGTPGEENFSFCPYCGLNIHEYQEVFARINLAEYADIQMDCGISHEEIKTLVEVARRIKKFMADVGEEKALLRVLSYVEDGSDGN